MPLVLVLGGARSGKSRFAEELAAASGPRVIYVATAAAGDEEMARRIARHRLRRPPEWQTVEEGLALEEVIRRYGHRASSILVDCLTGWVSNLLLAEGLPRAGCTPEEKEEYILRRADGLARAAAALPARVIAVAGEVGMGLVPPYPLGRAFRDVAGEVNQLMARHAEQVYLVVAGLPVEIKGLAANRGSHIGGN
ncbi:bifunctional adenosylcobinamide kinase/adenosylcobinamide-phosphate guanylyltransferase [Desulfovirgula thermocuniculi]|uniref:bifunctional adenosylcobinamide kinase/adenosylcobinamide-phosphate guanylyltransferase n=1 Tax=Desulfovirgula thermocuniculi TaxID=348842 RepID=UPI00041D2693|nr:bifunctional adenosylcobinamide kinase/adenosylcobinamide-phosphate guanylyltransferase [Desulfovirgula thermocuniculi]